jgi:hypothetical protein
MSKEAIQNIAGFMRGGKFFPIRSSQVWPKGDGGKRPPPRQAALPYNEFIAGDFDRRSRRLQAEDQTLSQFVRSEGGIRPDRHDANRGEWRALTYHESGVRGLAFEKARRTAEDMSHQARELGFRVPSDPNEFLDALAGDAAGYKVIRHPEWYEREAERLYMSRNPSNPSFLATWTVKATSEKASTIIEAPSPQAARAAIRTMLREGSYTRLTIAGRPGDRNMFTAEDARAARKVSAPDYRKGMQVKIKGTKKTAFIKSPIRSGQKVVAYVLSTGAVAAAEDVEFLNPARSSNEQEKYARELAAARGAQTITPAHRARLEKAGQAAGLTLREVRAQMKRAQAKPNGILVTDATLPKGAVGITPTLARQMLRFNVGNRPLDSEKVNAISASMRRGTFTRRTPVVFTNNILTDGQHTLTAIVKSGVTVPLKIQHKEINPLGEIGLQTVGGIAAGAAGAVAGAMLAPIIERYVKGTREKKAALAAVKTVNPAPNEQTAATLAALGRSRLIKAASELAKAVRPGVTRDQQRAAKQKAAIYDHEGRDLLKRAGQLLPPQRNPTTAHTPPAVRRLHQEFRGLDTTGNSTKYFVPPGTPTDTAFLGQLERIILKDGRVLDFTNNPAALLGTAGKGRRRLVVGLTRAYATPTGARPDQVLNYGDVATIEYVTPKPHLYPLEPGEKLFYHFLGEEGGSCPRLVLQNGRLALRGGDYTITREGIRN